MLCQLPGGVPLAILDPIVALLYKIPIGNLEDSTSTVGSCPASVPISFAGVSDDDIFPN